MNISHGKLAVYLLTFLGYIYSGYGSGLLGNLRDAILTAETVFGDVVQNVIKVAEKFRNVHEVFDAAVEEDCVFKCPTGVLPRANRNHVPSANGCGSYGLKINSDYLPSKGMEKCCDAHDICYDTCNKDKEVCDVDFKRCLYKLCDEYSNSLGGQSSVVKACKGAAKILFTGTLTLGCKSYIEAQKQACYCPPLPGWKEKKSKYATGGPRNDL